MSKDALLIHRVPDEIRAGIERVAQKDDRSISNASRQLLREALRHRGELPRDDDSAAA
jgi:hypothetical protein